MKKYNVLIYFLFLVLSISLPCGIFADTVYLKNGEELNGTITAQTRAVIKITVNGEPRTINKTDIRRIQFGKLPEKPAEPVETEQEKQLREKREKEEQKKQAEAEARKQKEEEKRLKAEADEQEKETKRLAAEEEKKLKESARDEKQKAKRERIDRLSNKHFLSIGASAGKADHHFTTENFQNGLYNTITGIFYNLPIKWDDTGMDIQGVVLQYNWKRIFIDMEYQRGNAKPNYISFQDMYTNGDPIYHDSSLYSEKFNLNYSHGTITAGYKFFPFGNFEISPILSFQKSEVTGKSFVSGWGGASETNSLNNNTIWALPFISLNENENSYNGKTYMGGVKIKYAFNFPIEFAFTFQNRKTFSNYQYTMHKNGITGSIFEAFPLSFEIKGLVIRNGADAALKMQYNKESWNTSFFIKFEGYREAGKFVKSKNKISSIASLVNPKKPGDDPSVISAVLLNSDYARSQFESLEKHAAVSLGATYNFDFNK